MPNEASAALTKSVRESRSLRANGNVGYLPEVWSQPLNVVASKLSGSLPSGSLGVETTQGDNHEGFRVRRAAEEVMRDSG